MQQINQERWLSARAPRAALLLIALVASPAAAQPPEADAGAAADAGVPEPDAGAPEPDAGAPADPDALTPPALLEAAPVRWPEGLEPPEEERPVRVLVTIDAEGAVVAAEVQEAALEAPLAEVARDAASRSRFTPATRGGAPMASRVVFVVLLPARAPVEPEPAPAEAEAEPAPEPMPAPEPPDPAPEEEPEPIEVVAQVDSVAVQREESAEAVDVVDLAEVRRTPSELSEVLARREGVSVRRSGGLGSGMRLSLAGMSDDRIRIFLDEVPIEFAGFVMGFGNMPVQLLERVEIYRGVLPIRYGADALGGAIDLVTPRRLGRPSAALNYQVGSFGTHRLSLTASARHARTGLFARANGFFDNARNDFRVEVLADDASGARRPVRVPRLHDAFRAGGGSLELGVMNHRRLERLSVRAFVTEYSKELQHNTVMSVPYGEARFDEGSYGATARASVRIGDDFRFVGIAGYAHQRTDFRDQALCIYDWYDQCGRVRDLPGEISVGGYDQRVTQDAWFGRLRLAWEPREGSGLRLSVAPTYVDRGGVDRTVTSSQIDPLSLLRRQLSVVTGLEGHVSLLDERLELIAFVKSYVYAARSEEPGVGDAIRSLSRDDARFGGGASGRYRLSEQLYLKLSYEYATRLPSPDELFGDGVLIRSNLGLEPELSHNLNFGATFERPVGEASAIRLEGTFFGRFTDKLILLLGTDSDYGYNNVYAARALGVEASARYIAPREHGYVGANLTYQSFRNVATEGTFARYAGDRIPNQPGLFVNVEASGQLHDLLTEDSLSLTAVLRFVEGYYRGWESVGSRDSKQAIPPQAVLTTILTYAFELDRTKASLSFEVRNLTDAKVYDFFGIQRPGRAYFLQLSAEL